MRRAILLLATGVAVAAWLFATGALATGDWWLQCSGDGGTMTGIDCLEDLPGSARADTAPARWFGLTPLVLIWLAAATAIPALAVQATRRGPTA